MMNLEKGVERDICMKTEEDKNDPYEFKRMEGKSKVT